MPPPIRQLTRELLHDPAVIQVERQAGPAVGITQAIYPVPQHLKAPLLNELLKNQELQSVICFTRTKHRANRLADHLRKNNILCAPIHGNRTQAQRNAALAGFKDGSFRVLVATDIAARGIDIEAVSHVINFDCPHLAEDYIHRVGRTGRASLTGDAFTFVSPEEEGDLRTIERAVGKRLPRVTLPGFDYNARPTEKLEVPIAERIAAIRAQKSAERARHDQRIARQNGQPQGRPSGQAPGHGTAQGRSHSHPANQSQNSGQNRHPGQSGRYQGQGKKKHFNRGPGGPKPQGGGWGAKPGHG
jgi:ATP-dependent RNA helicase RhlE